MSSALHSLGSKNRILETRQLIQLGHAPTRIDLLTSITGVSSEEAFASKVSALLDGIRVFVLGKDALVRKQARSRSASGSGRHRYIGKLTPDAFGPDITYRRRTFGRTNVASSVAVLPQGPALRRVSLASQPAPLFPA